MTAKKPATKKPATSNTTVLRKKAFDVLAKNKALLMATVSNANALANANEVRKIARIAYKASIKDVCALYKGHSVALVREVFIALIVEAYSIAYVANARGGFSFDKASTSYHAAQQALKRIIGEFSEKAKSTPNYAVKLLAECGGDVNKAITMLKACQE
jgi:hypothetical protein